MATCRGPWRVPRAAAAFVVRSRALADRARRDREETVDPL